MSTTTPLPENLRPSRTQRVYAVVQHSAAGTHGEFSRAVESRGVLDVLTARKIHEAGGLLFASYAEAEEAAERLNYPPGTEGIVPGVAPGGSWGPDVQGLRAYIPPAPAEHDAPAPVVVRDGASLYTADELTLLFIDDAVSLGAELSASGKDDRDDLTRLLKRQRDKVSGSAHFPDSAEGVNAQDRANRLAQQLETDLHTVDRRDGGTGFVVTWNDGYVIRPLCSHPACIDDDQHDEE